MRLHRLLLPLFFSIFALPLFVQAQIIPAQNQLILSPYGGFIVATSSSGISKLSATTTPYFANFFFGHATGTSLGLTTLCLSLDCRTAWPTGSTFGTTSISALFPIFWDTSLAQISFLGLTTSTPAVIGNIPYFTGVNTFGNVATTSVSCSGSTNCTSFTAIGASPITISSTDAGGTVTQIDTTFPILGGPITTTGTLSFGGLATSSPWTGSGIAYRTSDNTIATAATGTVGAGAGISVTAGQSIIGSGLTITNTGVTSIAGVSPIVNSLSTGDITLSCPTCIVTGNRDWLVTGSPAYLTPTTTIGIGVFSSSTIGSGAQAGGLTISGGATTTGNAYFAGNVGIGDPNPSAALDIRGSTPQIHIETTNASNAAELKFFTPTHTMSFGTNDTSGSSGGSGFFDNTNSAWRLFIERGGDVGIGTDTPGYKLDVNGGDIFTSGNYVISGGHVLKNSGTSDKFGIWGGTDFSNGPFVEFWPEGSSSNQGNLLFEFGSRSTQLTSSYFNIAAGDGFGSGNSALRILQNGNVGIGTTTPYSKLHVSSGAGATTTVTFGEVGSATSDTCFNTKNTAGSDISFYFVGTTMVVENNKCR